VKEEEEEEEQRSAAQQTANVAKAKEQQYKS